MVAGDGHLCDTWRPYARPVDPHERLGHLSADELAPMVAALLDEPSAQPTTWQVEQLASAALNPSTLALQRVRGVADTRDGQRSPFSLVAKTVADPDPAAVPVSGYIHQPQDWNYWKREPIAFSSGLLDGYDGPLRPIRCLRVEDHGTAATMWLEELHDDAAAGWTPQRHVLAAEHLGRFTGDHRQAADGLADQQWPCRGFTRGWVRTLGEFGATAACESEDLWRHLALCGEFGASTRRRVADVLAEADALLSLGDQLPQSLAHHDAHQDNMFRRDSAADGPTTAILDRGFLGVAPLGEDLGNQLAMNVFFQHVAATEAPNYERAAAAAYLRGLSHASVDADPDPIRAHAWAVAAVRGASYAAAHVAWLSEDPDETDEPAWPTAWAAARQISAAELMSRWAAALNWFLQCADDARRVATGQ